MIFTIWDGESNNLVAEFKTFEDALALVRSGIERNGSQDTESLILEAEDEQGDVQVIAHGRQLAELANGHAVLATASAS